MFIVLEGQECAGKSTQAANIAQYLRSNSSHVIQTREPGGSVLAEQIRSIILSGGGISDPLTELFLISAARSDHIQRVIKPALQAKNHVICDRFYGSSIAYQVYGKGLSPEIAWQIITPSLNHIEPDLVLLLDVEYETSLKRANLRSEMEASNHYDKQNFEMFEKIRLGFLQIAAQKNNWVTIDANVKPDVVWHHIKQYLVMHNAK